MFLQKFLFTAPPHDEPPPPVCLDESVEVQVKGVSEYCVRLVIKKNNEHQHRTTVHGSVLGDVAKAMRKDGTATLLKARYDSKDPEPWLTEVVRLAQWGKLRRSVVAVLEALLHDDDVPKPVSPKSPTRPMKDDDRIRELEGIVASLKRQLSDKKIPEEKTLEELEKELKNAATKLLAGDDAAEADLDRLDAAIQAHPSYADRMAKEEARWEHEERDKNDESLAVTRRIVPRDIARSSAATIEDLFLRHLQDPRMAKDLAKRVFATNALWLVWLDPERIKKLHPSDLRHRYSATGLDIIELRAVYAALPTSFDNDPLGHKAAWRTDLRTKLVALVAKERSNALGGGERRHPAYRRLPADFDVNSDDDSRVPPRLPSPVAAEKSPPIITQQQQRRTVPRAKNKPPTADLMAAIQQRRRQLRDE